MKLSKIFWLFAAFLIVFAFVQTLAAQAKNNPQTVTDYYLLLPANNLPALKSVKSRRALIKTEDAKNGFLRLEGAWEGWAEIALFRKTNREAVIAVQAIECAPACSGAAQFLTYKNGKWTDVTAETMPRLDDADILAAYNRIKTKDDDAHTLDDLPFTYWQLPQRGTTLKLVVGDAGGASEGKTLLSFDWNGARFVTANK